MKSCTTSVCDSTVSVTNACHIFCKSNSGDLSVKINLASLASWDLVYKTGKVVHSLGANSSRVDKLLLEVSEVIFSVKNGIEEIKRI